MNVTDNTATGQGEQYATTVARELATEPGYVSGYTRVLQEDSHLGEVARIGRALSLADAAKRGGPDAEAAARELEELKCSPLVQQARARDLSHVQAAERSGSFGAEAMGGKLPRGH